MGTKGGTFLSAIGTTAGPVLASGFIPFTVDPGLSLARHGPTWRTSVVASVEATVTGFLQAHYPDNPDVRALVQGASLLRSGLLDSMAAYELVGILERRYGIEILDAEIVPENFDSIRQIEGLVARKLGDTSPR